MKTWNPFVTSCRPRPAIAEASLALALCASAGLAQSFTPVTDISPLGAPPVHCIANSGGASGGVLTASTASFNAFGRLNEAAGPWAWTGTSVSSQANLSPFVGPSTAIAGFDGVTLVSPKNRGIWRATDAPNAFTKGTGVAIWSGWGANFEFGAVGFAKANNQLYAFMDFDEGNFSNGHAGSWIAYGSAGVMRSNNAGASWVSASNGLPTYGFDSLAGTTFEQNVAFTGAGNLLMTLTNFEKLFRSVGTGAWQQVAGRGGLPNFSTFMRWVEIKQLHAFDSQNVIALVGNAGLYRSTNAGLSFTPQPVGPVASGGDGLPFRVWYKAIAQTNEGLFVAVDPQPPQQNFTDPNNPPPLPARVYPLYVSQDQGRTFRPFGRGLDGPDVGLITSIAAHAGRVYVVTSTGVFAAPACRADVAGPGSVDLADNELTADDIIAFVGWFIARDARADVSGPSTPAFGSPDGEFTADDVLTFINAFSTGC